MVKQLLRVCDLQFIETTKTMNYKLQTNKKFTAETKIAHAFLADRTIGRAYGTVCRLSVCLSVCPSVTFCIVAKRCILVKKCLKE